MVSPRGMLVKDLIVRKSRWSKSAWLRLIERRTLANAAALHLTTNTEAVEAEKLGLRLPRSIVVPNGVDAPEDGKQGSLSPKVRQAVAGGQFILFLGRVNWEKGLDRLIPERLAARHVSALATLALLCPGCAESVPLQIRPAPGVRAGLQSDLLAQSSLARLPDSPEVHTLVYEIPSGYSTMRCGLV